MLTLLIADDEFFILERLKRITDYPALGYNLTAAVLNGRDAMQIIEEESPDLAILDIKMPFLSGLDIAGQIYEKNLKTKVVILTSYDYFNYAKQAIKYQVFSYLLKPVNVDELKEILADAAREIGEQRQRDSQLKEYKHLRTGPLLRHLTPQDQASMDPYNKEAAVTSAVVEMIQSSYSDPRLDLPCIAEKVGYTQNYISSIFKRNTGLTVVQYITQCRMNAANILLTVQHMPVNQVYSEVGYSNPFYFSKRFKQYFGYSPSECPGALASDPDTKH